MTRYYLFSILFLLLSLNIEAQVEKDSLLAKDVEFVIEELRFIHDMDQSLRKYLEYGTMNTKFTDSIENLTKGEIKVAEETLQLSPSTRKEVWNNFLSPLDSLKAIRMIEIVEKYGFPSVKRLEKFSGKKLNFSPQVIFVHIPFNFSDKMIPIIEREYRLGNLKNKCQYGYLLWHLNGRSDFSFMTENGYKLKKNKDGSFELTHSCK